MEPLHLNQEKIINLLERNSGGLSLPELSDFLGLSKTAVKVHLEKLDWLGFIDFEDRKGRIGRPRRFYFINSEKKVNQSRQYTWLSSSLLHLLVKSLGIDHVREIMNELASEVVFSMQDKFKESQTTLERLATLNSIMNELGYRSRIKQKDIRKGIIIEATNCVYHDVAKEFSELCHFDIQLIKLASGKNNVKLDQCIAKGGASCRFRIKD